MTDSPMNEIYQRQVASEIRQFANTPRIVERPAALRWWYERYQIPRLQAVFGAANELEVIAAAIGDAVRRTGLTDVISLGASDGVIEVGIIEAAIRQGQPWFRIHGLELSPILVASGRQRAAEMGLAERLFLHQADLNRGVPDWLDGPVAAVSVTSVLHHVVELETLFDSVLRVLHPQGSFVVEDVVGRNGHRRWPEVLGLVRAIWATLPEALRFDHVRGRPDRWYEDWDYATEGFEGQRAQDVLPLLLQRFVPERAHVWGCLVEMLIGDCFAANFNPDVPEHAAYIDRVQQLEDRILEARLTTPTAIFGVFRPQGVERGEPVLFRDRAAQWGLRPPRAGLPQDLAALGYQSPFPPPLPPPLVSAPLGVAISFGAAGDGGGMLRWGWSGPEADLTWGLGAASAIAFIAVPRAESLTVRSYGYVAPGRPPQAVAVRLNGRPLGALAHSAEEPLQSTGFALPTGALRPDGNLLEFETTQFRLPDLDGGDERRELSLALVSLALE
jgi:SAM-dependent methyltransferase